MCGRGKQWKIENGEVYFPRCELYGTLIPLGIALLNPFRNFNCDFPGLRSLMISKTINLIFKALR